VADTDSNSQTDAGTAGAGAVRAMVEPLAAAVGADVYDVTLAGGKLAVALDRREGIDLDTLAGISRELGQRLDEHDVVGGSYTLEVTSPGLERNLRTPTHFRGAVGESVTVRTIPGTESERRVRGRLVEADDDGLTVAVEDDAGRPTGEHRTVAYDRVERARTTFAWGPAPKPGSSKGRSGKSKSKSKSKSENRPNQSTSGKEASSR
jgi:ribosome maturation factor RimP